MYNPQQVLVKNYRHIQLHANNHHCISKLTYCFIKASLKNNLKRSVLLTGTLVNFSWFWCLIYLYSFVFSYFAVFVPLLCFFFSCLLLCWRIFFPLSVFFLPLVSNTCLSYFLNSLSHRLIHKHAISVWFLCEFVTKCLNDIKHLKC